MQDPVYVGGTLKKWSFVLPLLITILFLGLAAASFSDDWGATPPLLVIGLVFLTITIAVGAVTTAGRRWISIGEDLFTIRERGGDTEVRDDDVLSISLLVKRNFSEGILKSISRNIFLWVDTKAGIRRFKLTHTLPVDFPDPLEGWIDRLSQKLYDRSKEDIEAGRTLEGDTWTLRREALHVRRGAAAQELRTEEIAAVEFIDDFLCIWKKDEENPAVRLPADSMNCFILGRILQDLIPKDAEGKEPTTENLGRIIFERKASASMIRTIRVLAAILVISGVSCLFAMEFEQGMVLCGVMAGAGVLMALGSLYASNSAFRCHEYGVCKKNPFGQKRLRYLDVELFTYSATRQFVNGVYNGTTLALAFVPRPDVNAKSIAYGTTLKGMDDSLESLREHISNVIAARMARDLADGRAVQWTPNLRFLPDALEFRPAGFFGRKDPVNIPFSEVEGFNMDQGTFHLWVKGQENSVIQEQASQPNFFPGLVLLNHLFREPDAEAQGSESPQPDTEA